MNGHIIIITIKHGDKVVAEMCNRLELPNAFKECGMIAAREHMRASKFNEMRVPKKVDFLVSNFRNKLGLYGLEIIVNSDKERTKDILFAKLGEQMIKKVNGKEIINKDNFEKVKEEIRRKRIEWLKQNIDN